jgi:hypothetical protein
MEDKEIKSEQEEEEHEAEKEDEEGDEAEENVDAKEQQKQKQTPMKLTKKFRGGQKKDYVFLKSVNSVEELDTIRFKVIFKR